MFKSITAAGSSWGVEEILNPALEEKQTTKRRSPFEKESCSGTSATELKLAVSLADCELRNKMTQIQQGAKQPPLGPTKPLVPAAEQTECHFVNSVAQTETASQPALW